MSEAAFRDPVVDLMEELERAPAVMACRLSVRCLPSLLIQLRTTLKFRIRLPTFTPLFFVALGFTGNAKHDLIISPDRTPASQAKPSKAIQATAARVFLDTLRNSDLETDGEQCVSDSKRYE